MARLDPRALLGIALLLTLTACGRPGAEPWEPLPVEYDDDDAAWLPTCEGDEGPQQIVLCADDESHTPLEDGATYGIARRPQGAITFMAPIWFVGLEGGKQIQELAFYFRVDGYDEPLGDRVTAGYVLPCEEDGSVAAHDLEIFFYPGVDVDTYIGLVGTLTVEADLGLGHVLSDEVEAILVEDE